MSGKSGENQCKKKKKDITEKGLFYDLQIFKSIIENNNNAINKIIEDRLKKYKEYFSQPGNESDTNGLFLYKLAGLCAFLNDIGFKITIESDYLPKFLIEGDFTKEKLTWPMV